MGPVVAITVAGSVALTPVARRLAWSLGAVSRPDGKRRRQAQPTAVWGGMAVFVALLAGIVAICVRQPAAVAGCASWYAALGLSAAGLCLLGCYDDLVDLRARWKLAGQLVSVFPLILSGHYVENLVLLGQTIHLGPSGAAWTMGWLILGINALNLIDGMDGLASVIGIVTSVAITLIAMGLGSIHSALVAMALAGALLGFVIYNLPPARIYLGDCGSMVIGLLLAVLALELTPRPGTANLTVLAGLLFVPLLDTTLAIIRRTISGRGIMVADRGHLHHRLLDRGFSIWTVLGILGTCSLVSGTAAWMAAVRGHDLAAWSILLAGTAWCVRHRVAGHVEWAMVVSLLRRPASDVPSPPVPISVDRRAPHRAAMLLPTGAGEPPATLSSPVIGQRAVRTQTVSRPRVQTGRPEKPVSLLR